MQILTLRELFDLVLMIAIVGYIFKDAFIKRPIHEYDPLKHIRNFSFEEWKFAIMVTAPAIALHEASHKIVAMAFGLPAVFHAAYQWLIIGLVLKMLNTGFIFFVPGFVSFPGGLATPLQQMLIAFAGPGFNLLLWVFATLSLKNSWMPSKYNAVLGLTKQINLFLFIFNMIPFGPFDGAHVFSGLFQLF